MADFLFSARKLCYRVATSINGKFFLIALGVGTDIGGSVRIPSSFCGLYALRPCYNRIPYGHALNTWLGQISVLSVIGPMARSLEGLDIFYKTVLDLQPANYDATALPFPFRADLRSTPSRLGKLCFGIVRTDGIRTPHLPIQRALQLTVDVLLAAGHEGWFDLYSARMYPMLHR